MGLRTKSTQLCEFFQEPIYNLETGEYYSSRFHQHAVKITLLLGQRWKQLLGLTTTCLVLLFTGSAVVTTCRRRLPLGNVTPLQEVVISGKKIKHQSKTNADEWKCKICLLELY